PLNFAVTVRLLGTIRLGDRPQADRGSCQLAAGIPSFSSASRASRRCRISLTVNLFSLIPRSLGMGWPLLSSINLSILFTPLQLGISVVFDSPFSEPSALGSGAPLWCSRASSPLPAEPGAPLVPEPSSPSSTFPPFRGVSSCIPLSRESLPLWTKTRSGSARSFAVVNFIAKPCFSQSLPPRHLRSDFVIVLALQ
ncbi:hypothetical protein C8J57DRAFT_1637895, partial [Mycena rebaudengoi]